MSGLTLLDPARIGVYWGEVRPFIARACERSRGRYRPEHVYDFVFSGDWQLWIYRDELGIAAVCCTEVVRYPTGILAIGIRIGTGRNREKWQHHMEDVVAWGKACGCSIAEGIMRKGWRRVLPNWFHTHDYLERTL